MYPSLQGLKTCSYIYLLLGSIRCYLVKCHPPTISSLCVYGVHIISYTYACVCVYKCICICIYKLYVDTCNYLYLDISIHSAL